MFEVEPTPPIVAAPVVELVGAEPTLLFPKLLKNIK